MEDVLATNLFLKWVAAFKSQEFVQIEQHIEQYAYTNIEHTSIQANPSSDNKNKRVRIKEGEKMNEIKKRNQNNTYTYTNKQKIKNSNKKHSKSR
jgi:hypothetical protein